MSFYCVRDANGLRFFIELVNIVFQNHENSTCGEIRGLVMKFVRFVGSPAIFLAQITHLIGLISVVEISESPTNQQLWYISMLV